MTFRIRTQGSLTGDPTGTTLYKTFGNGTTTQTAWSPPGSPSYLEGSSKRMIDITTPGYSKIIAKGGVVNSPMYQGWDERSHSYGTFSYYKPVATGPLFKETSFLPRCAHAIYYGGGEAISRDLSLSIDNLLKQAGTDAKAAVAEPEFEALAFAGELRESLSFLHSPLRKWQQFVEKARRDGQRSLRQKLRKKVHNRKTNPEAIRTTADWISSNWLAYRMGVRPIVSETQDAARAVAATYLDNKPTRRTARGFASDSKSYSETFSFRIAPFDVKRDETSSRDVMVRSGVLYQINRYGTKPGYEFGLDNQRIPRNLWEILPFSWAVDYFANVGSYIGALEPKIQVRELATWTTVKDSRTTDATCYTSGADSPWVVTSNGLCTLSVKQGTFTRTRGISIGLVLKQSPIRGLSGAAKITDLIAVTTQLLSKRL